MKIDKIDFSPTAFQNCQDLFLQYLVSLSGVYDNYLEDHILDSSFYTIIIEENTAGYFAVNKDNYHDSVMLTQFYIRKEWRVHAQNIFKKIIAAFKIENAYVPTCDELFLSLCIENHEEIEIQSFTFEQSGVSAQPAEFPRGDFKLLPKDRWDEVNAMTENFFEEIYRDKVKKDGLLFEIYELSHGGTVLGYGLREGVRIFTAYNATGMYVMPQHRQKGVGRSIILHLKDVCIENGKKPMPGCWFYNFNSKATLESAGYVPKTRLLHIVF